MASETITVYIDPAQLVAQKKNQYSLFLAKMVNRQFTVIWQSRGAIATVNNPSYQYQNTFEIDVPSYQVNYGTVTTSSGSVTFSAAGLAQTIDIGQVVELDSLGLFGTPSNTGTPGDITIKNELAANPHAILLDNTGNPIFVNTQSGMDIGTATLTPVDTYQIWFDNYQETGTIIAHQVSNAATVTFKGGSTNQVISYTAAGKWQNGPLARTIDLSGVASLAQGGDPLTITVLATFKYALTVSAVTYLLSKLIEKFPPGLIPDRLETGIGSWFLRVWFRGPHTREILAAFGLDKHEQAVNQALLKAKADPTSDMQSETWTLSEPTLTVSY